MEQIKHNHVAVRGLKLHVAETGTGGKVVLFLHGFPEMWYTWRHQVIGVANAGYRAIAIDFRGYGLSDQPAEPKKATFMDLVHDVISLLDTLGISKVFIVAKDFGSIAANLIASLYLERVCGFTTIGVPSMLPGPNIIIPESSYARRWQEEPGRAEADFGRLDVKTVIRNIYILFSGAEIPIARDDEEIMDSIDSSTPLPPWLSDQDLHVYASLYEKSGFSFALQVPYRALGIDCGVRDQKITCAALLIMGEKDYVLKVPGMEEYIKSGEVKRFVPDLEIVFIEEGNHFVHEKLHQLVNDLLINFLNKLG